MTIAEFVRSTMAVGTQICYASGHGVEATFCSCFSSPQPTGSDAQPEAQIGS